MFEFCLTSYLVLFVVEILKQYQYNFGKFCTNINPTLLRVKYKLNNKNKTFQKNL